MSAATQDADAIVVGAGHNGLISAAYLARAGLNVHVLERRSVVGGACVTEELIPGARFSTCAYVCSTLRPEIIHDLELEKHGLDMYTTDILNFVMNEQGEHLFLWPELDRTLKEIERLSSHDARTFVEFGARFRRFAKKMTPYLLQEPPTLSEVLRDFEESGEIDLWHEFSSLSIRDLIERYFEHPMLQGLFMFFGLVSIHAGPDTPGTAYEFSHHSWGEYKGEFGRFAFVNGGMGGITQAIARSAESAGATITVDAEVDEILVGASSVSGVRLSSGKEIHAPVVLSNADPQRTYLQLLPDASIPNSVRTKAERLDFRGTMGRVHMVLNELPQYLGCEPGEGPQHRGFSLLGGSPEEYTRCWEAQQRGELVDNYPVELIIPSIGDPSMAPPGRHIVTTGLCQLPFELAEGTWDSRRDEFADRVIRSMSRFAPDLESSIESYHVLTPLDLEREYSLTGGNIYHGAMTINQLFDSRPGPGQGGYRLPIPGAYLCGAGTHPGGAVMGASGHNAAGAVLADLRGEKRSRTPVRSEADLTDRLATSPRLRPVRDWAVRRRALRPLVRRLTNR